MFFNFNNIILADESLLKQAESGNAEAQYKVAALYASGKLGNKTEDDRKKMFDWLEKSANQDYLKAQEILCKQYYDREEFEKSFKWTNKALKKGSKVAKSIMAGFLMNGYDGLIPIDKAKAIALAKECPDEIVSKCILCEVLTNGWLDTEPDYEKAMAIAEELSNKKYYGADIYKSLILRHMPGFSTSDYINAIIEAFEKAIQLNKFSYMAKSAYVDFAIDIFQYRSGLKNKIEEYTDDLMQANKPLGFYCNYLYESKVKNNRTIAEKYLLQAADGYCPESYFKAYNAYLTKNDEDSLSKARNIAQKALKCQDPDCLKNFIVFFNIIEKNEVLRNVVGEAYIEGFNSIETVKKAADNGSSEMMYLYSKLTTNNTEKERYLKGAVNKHLNYACGELAFNLLKTNPQKAYDIIKSSKNKYINDSPEIYYVDGICAIEGKVREKDIYYGLGQLGRAYSSGMEDNSLLLKTLYEGYCNIDEKEYLKIDKSLNSERLKYYKDKDIYTWGTRYIKYASEEEKKIINEKLNNLMPEAVSFANKNMLRERDHKLTNNLNNPVYKFQLTNLGKIFADVSTDSINNYVNYNLYNSLFKLYGKNKTSPKNNSSQKDNSSKEEDNEIPDYCMDNMKKIKSAVWMYNMDNVRPMSSLNLKKLEREKYLKGGLNTDDPECSYSVVDTKSGCPIVICSKHGRLDLSE